MVSSAEVVIRTTSPDVKVDAMCVTPTGDVLCVGTKMGGRVWHGEIHSTCPSRQPARTNLRRRSHHPRDPKPLTRSSLFLPPSFPQTLHRARASRASRPPARGSPPSPSSPTAPSSPAATRGSSRRGPCPETSSRGPSTSRAAARTPTTPRSPRWRRAAAAAAATAPSSRGNGSRSWCPPAATAPSSRGNDSRGRPGPCSNTTTYRETLEYAKSQ